MPGPIKLLLVAGARPNFMKVAPIIRQIQQRPLEFDFVLVHTGQHYDEDMSEVFFSDLEIPQPHYHLNVGSGSHSEQTAKVMTAFEPICNAEKPACVVVFGDVNSTLACSIVAKKLKLDVAHIEAGLRSGDREMPEEINRIVTDSISDLLFVTERSGRENLMREGHGKDSVFFVGHVMIDNLYHELSKLDDVPHCSSVVQQIRKKTSRYGVVTLHRPSNVDDEAVLRGIVDALNDISQSLDLVFAVHPRTRKMLDTYGIRFADQIIATEPLGYREFLSLWRDSLLVLTDSGGLQEESTALGIPCLTIRENTERPITIEEGTNTLVGSNPERIVAEARRVLVTPMNSDNKRVPEFWDGHASLRILNVLAKRYEF